MKHSEAAEFWPLIKAWGEGKTLQYSIRGQWQEAFCIDFSGYPSQYRIKPEPREFYVSISEYGVCGASDARDGKPICPKGISILKVREVLEDEQNKC